MKLFAAFESLEDLVMVYQRNHKVGYRHYVAESMVVHDVLFRSLKKFILKILNFLNTKNRRRKNIL